MAKKNYVLDTSVYLTDAEAIFKFDNHDIFVPLKVLEEIDKHKKRQDSVGVNARHIIRILDELRVKGDLNKGVRIDKGKGMLKVMSYSCLNNSLQFPPDLDLRIPDHTIIATAMAVKVQAQEAATPRKVIVVSRDINMRVICDSLGLSAEDYITEKAVNTSEELFQGFIEHLVDDAVVDRFYEGCEILIPEEETEIPWYPNQYVMLVSNANLKKTALARFFGPHTPLKKVIHTAIPDWNINSRNKEQAFAIDLLMDPKVKIVSLVGRAGSGKTLLAISAALQQTIGLRENPYTRMIVSRPIQSMGKDIGFLPGPQPLAAKVLTPDGWITMGEIEKGLRVIGSDGKSKEVIDVFPQGIREVYSVTTSDGRTTECCDSHLWYTETLKNRRNKNKGSAKTLKEIRETLRSTDKRFNNRLNHFLPRVSPIEYNTNNALVIKPYTLGALLGDGSFGKSGHVCLTSIDEEIIERVRKEISDMDVTLATPKAGITYNIRTRKPLYNNKTSRRVMIYNKSNNEKKIYSSIGACLKENNHNRSTLQSRCQNNRIINDIQYSFLPSLVRWQNPMKESLHKIGLLGKTGVNKYIPEEYMKSSIEDRLSLLQGLMDTDGSVNTKKGSACFYNTSNHLAVAVRDIVRSLGGNAKISVRKKRERKHLIDGRVIKNSKECYEVNLSLPEPFNPFYIDRKAKYYRSKYSQGIKIESIELVGKKKVKCIKIDSPDHLYVTDDYLLTHNTMEEKMLPWLMPIQDNLQFLLGGDKTALELYIEKGKIEIEALTYIRGRSISNAFIIIDEAQNLTMHEIKTIITRVGEGTKIVLTGDIEQIDNAYVNETSNGLAHAVEKFKEFALAGHVTFRKGERSDVASLAAKVL